VTIRMAVKTLMLVWLLVLSQLGVAQETGDLHKTYRFVPTNEDISYRVYVPTTWNSDTSLPIILMLHGAGADENTYMDLADGMLKKLAEEHGYIVVSPLGHTPLGAYGNPLRLPAVFGEEDVAAEQIVAVTPERQRILSLSELEVLTVLDIVTEEYDADRSRTYLMGHSMGSGGAWHIGARHAERWRAIAPISGPFVDRPTYPFDLIRNMPILITEGLQAPLSLEGSRRMAAWMEENGFDVRYLEVEGDHGGMVPNAYPAIFDFFNGFR